MRSISAFRSKQGAWLAAVCAAALCLTNEVARAQQPTNSVAEASTPNYELDATPLPSVPSPGSLNPPWLHVHGFVSQGFILSLRNNYLAESKSGSFEFSEVGLNVSADLSQNLRIGMQLFTRDVGPLGNYTAQLDWFNLDYRFRDWLGIRLGRTKLPFGLFNETSDIDAARVPVLLPQSLYPIDHRDFLLAQTGAELYGNVPLGDAGALEYRAYAGTLFIRPDLNPSPFLSVTRFHVPYVYGGRLMWNTPLEGLQLGGSAQALRFDLDYAVARELWPTLMTTGQVPSDFDGALRVKFRVKLWVASLEYAPGDLLLAAEYGRWVGEFDSSVPGIFPARTVNERAYVMASYRVRPWFTPGIYYAIYYPNIHDRKGRDSHRNDLAITFRYDVNQNWLFKLEGHFMQGTADLDPKLNGGTPVQQLSKDWGVLLLKTTAYF